MTYIPPKYPSEIPTIIDLPNRQDDVDWLVAARYNELKKELRAALIELGVLPKGTHADVAARLAACEFKIAPIAALPAPAEEHRRKFYCIEGGVGVTDKVYACLKSAGGAGGWSSVWDFGVGMYGAYNIADTFMLATLRNDQIWKSADGINWVLKQSTGEDRHQHAGGNAALLIAAADKAGRARAWFSVDAGESWAVDEQFPVGPTESRRVSPVAFGGEMYLSTYGETTHGDVYKRDGLGNWTKDLDTNSRAILALHISGINGYLYALTLDGKLYEKQNAMAAWTLKHSFSSSYSWRYLTDDGTTVYAMGGSTNPRIESSTDYDIWSNISIPPAIGGRYRQFICGITFGGALYCGTYAGYDGGDVLKYAAGQWSVDLDTGAFIVPYLEVFGGAVYAASSGVVGTGLLFRLAAVVESYSWVKIAEG